MVGAGGENIFGTVDRALWGQYLGSHHKAPQVRWYTCCLFPVCRLINLREARNPFRQPSPAHVVNYYAGGLCKGFVLIVQCSEMAKLDG